MRDRLRQLRDGAAGDRLDAQLLAARADANRARAAARWECRLERACGEVDAVRR
jgi:hypothetical protein